jgi:hypothetical protein
MGDLMDGLEDRAQAADDHNDHDVLPDWEKKPGEGRDEKPLVEPFDPYFGRRKDTLSWL